MSLFSFYDRRVFHIWNAFLQTCKKKQQNLIHWYVDSNRLTGTIKNSRWQCQKFWGASDGIGWPLEFLQMRNSEPLIFKA